MNHSCSFSEPSWDIKVTMLVAAVTVCKYGVLPHRHKAPVFRIHFHPICSNNLFLPVNETLADSACVAVSSWIFAHVCELSGVWIVCAVGCWDVRTAPAAGDSHCDRALPTANTRTLHIIKHHSPLQAPQYSAPCCH